ncbi:MAG TPA: hypothetical protein VF945_15585, partial [Polyangia bacterium]
MTRRAVVFVTSLAAALTLAAAAARAEDAGSADRGLADRSVSVEEDAPRAATVAREGQLLPGTLSATIGHKQVLGLFLGGYDSAPGQGPQFSALVEGQLFNRVALRVG